jgi:DNA-binding response OmpR family regulator
MIHPNILIVDDQPDMRQTLRAFLETAGYRVSEAGDGIEALRMARAARPDLILLDLNMPGPGGLTVLKKLKADPGFKAPVLVLTAGTDMESALAGIAAGADAYMTKPATRDQLLAQVTELLPRGPTRAGKRDRTPSNSIARQKSRGRPFAMATGGCVRTKRNQGPGARAEDEGGTTNDGG